MANIRAGYQFLATSWENDGDCYNTKSLDGLSLDDVKKLINICEFVRLGRWETNSDLERDIYQALGLEGLPSGYAFTEEELSTFNDEDYDSAYSDLMYELLGCAYESDYPRVLESWTVYYHPNEVQDISLMI